MGRAGWIAVAVFVTLTAACTWWLSGDEVGPGATRLAPPVEPVEPVAFVREPGHGDASADAGVGRVTGRVVLEDGTPVVGAEVVIHGAPAPTDGLECGVCHESVLDCLDPATVAQVLAGLRAGHLRRGQPELRTLTGPAGDFTFEAAPLGQELFVTSPRGTAEATTDDAEPLLLELSGSPAEDEGEVLFVVDHHDAPLAGARVTAYLARTGALAEFVTGADGVVKLPPALRDAWFGVEAEGFLPAGGQHRQVTLSPPMALTVRTTMGGKPVDADVSIPDLHRSVTSLRSRDGVLRLEGLAATSLRVSASTPRLTSGELTVELQDVENELRLELLAGAKLFITVVTESGEPVEAVSGDLSGAANETNLGASAEQGAPLVLGPVPEGEYRLTVSSDEFVTVTRSIDLRPGENTLEVTLRRAPTATGRVVDAKGAPVSMARVEVLDGEVEVGAAYTEEDGTFSVRLEQPGRFRLLAEEALTGRGEAPLTVPGPAAVVALQQRAVVEVEVFDHDGTALEETVLLRVERRVVDTLDLVPDTHLYRRAGLAPGKYVITISRLARLSVAQPIELRADQVLRLAVRLQEGATVQGRVLTASGAPVAEASVFAIDVDGSTSTDEQGRFEFKGLPSGAVELYGFSPAGVSTDEVKVTAPARDVVLTVKAGRSVKGRAVDERGAPLAGAVANDEATTGADGRFSVELDEDASLEVSLAGYLAVSIEGPAPDVGDVVLRRVPKLEGEVVDAQGRPVSGASVRSASGGEATSTDAAGRFSLQVVEEVPAELVASRGPLFGRAPAKAGVFTRVVLGPGTRVHGQVLGPAGGLATVVDVTSVSGGLPSEEVPTGADGRFELVLAEGVWSFSARTDRSARVVDVRGPEFELVLGDGGRACGLQVTAPEPIVFFTLFPPGDSTASGLPGSIEFPGRRESTTFTARGVPCGDYVAEVALRSGRVRQPVSVREKAQPFSVDLRLLDEDSPVLVLP